MSEDINPFTRKPVQQEGRIFFLCGTTGTGKTTKIKNLIRPLPLQKKIFDLDREYTEFKNASIFFDEKKTSAENVQGFKKLIYNEWEKVIVFSEAGIFFEHSTGFDMQMRELLKCARRRGNFVFFDFHSLSEVPIKMLKYCNYLFIKKTAMETKQQLSKFACYPEIIQSYIKVMDSDKWDATEVIIPRQLKISM